ncbi:MAG: prephenate dehydratase, partial [Proteobacteria bacterium]|nr:prephenate dehydratase [Pseudomonadota bacterium]
MTAALVHLGPPGSYSEQAARGFRVAHGIAARVEPVESLAAVAAAVRAGRAAFGVLPVLATTSGFPAEAHAALVGAPDPGWRVVGEATLPIVSHLLVRPGTRRADLRRVLSHPNALREAAATLARDFADLVAVETASTAEAARLVASGDGTAAAVAGPAAMAPYGLVPIAEAIQDDPHNATLFWLIAPAGAPPDPMPARVAILLDARDGSDRLGAAAAALHGLGFSIAFVSLAPLPGPPFAFRYAIAAAAPAP